MPYVLSALLLAIGLWLFVRPLRRISGGIDGDSLVDVLKDALVGAGPRSRTESAIRLAVALGCIAVLLPACLPIAAHHVTADTRRFTLIAGGIALVLTSVCTLLVFLVSGLSFGWGTSSTKPATLAGRLAPTFPFISGVAAILSGVLTDA
ncbi:MAG: hypothetical protein ACREJO_16715 [Phycisphaerales bacterium]